MKIENKKVCDHEFESAPGWENKYELRGLGETLEKEIVCRKCGLSAREVWIYSCIIRNDTEEII